LSDPSISTQSPLTTEYFLWLVPEEEIRGILNTRKIYCPSAGLKMEGTMWKGLESKHQLVTGRQ
jgi:hypothetical protein